MASEDDLNSEVEVTIGGLRKKEIVEGEDRTKEHTIQFLVRESDLFEDIWNKLLDSGFKCPLSLECGTSTYKIGSKKSTMLPYEEVIVVADDKPSTKNQVRLNETLLSHNNTHYGEMEFQINETYSNEVKKPSTCIETNYGLKISFERTPRMPDDNKLHQLPGSLGSFDLFSVSAFADKLPEKIKQSGGVFLAMWQREAMWINFEIRSNRPRWAVRVFVGHVNAVSGLAMGESADQKDIEAPVQDYIVMPGQEWLDGICVAPGVVRQFVAMPLGAGYTIEGQKTSEEKHGGLQIEIITEFESDLRWWVKQGQSHINVADNGSMTPARAYGLGELSTPAQLNLEVGDVLWSYPRRVYVDEPFKVRDLPREGGKVKCQAYYVYDRCKLRPVARMDAGPDSGETRTRSHESSVQAWSGRYDDVDMDREDSLDDAVASLDISTQRLPGSNEDYEEDEDDGESGLPDIEETIDIKAMGLAAGGKLIQDIYKDPYPAEIWNHASARIINVHILDPDSCEKVTHIVPLPPPKSVEQYIEDKGQFFVVEEKVDERVDGGDFDNVKSVSQLDKHIGVTTEPEFDPTKPKMCNECKIRLCDCIIRPCDHQFCNICIKKLEEQGNTDPILARKNWKCPTCGKGVSHVAGFSAPMNLPGEEAVKTRVPVQVLKITDGRTEFQSVHKSRV